MADLLQIPSCGGATGTFNSGIPICDILMDVPLGIIGLDSGVGFSAGERSSIATFVAALKTKTRAARGSRAYPFFQLVNFEDKSKEPTRATAGNLTNTEVITSDGIPSFSFEHRIGNLFHRKLLEAQNSGCTWMIVDKKYAIYGTLEGTSFRGYSLAEFFVGLPKFGTPSSVSKYPFEMTLASQTEYKENFAFFQADSTLITATGLRDVVLSEFSLAGSVIKVELTTLGGKNLTDLFSTELTQAAAWNVRRVSNGNAVTVTATFDSANKVMALTLSGAEWTGGTSSVDTYTADLVSAAALSALISPIDGYESTGALTFTKP